MNIEQAKEIFNIFLQDLEMNEDGNFILELRLNPDDTWSHFTPEDIKAFKMAFKSLEMWDKVKEELEEYKIIGSQMECFGTTEENVKEYIPIDIALEIINKHLKEVKNE